MQAIEKKSQWKSRAVICAVAGAHIVAASALLLIYGCSTTKPQPKVEPPATPIMPPTKEPSPVVEQPAVPPPPPVDLAPPAKESAASKSYVVQPGDSLSRIAHRAGVSSHELMELNGIKDSNKLRIGQKLSLPAYAKELPAGKVKETGAKKAAGAKMAAGAKKPAAEAAAGAGEYVVKPGDSLEKIAKKNGVKVSALKEANQLTSDKIRVGQKLTIPGKGGAAAPAQDTAPAAGGATPAPEAGSVAPAPVPTAMLDYTVQEGETVDSVAKTFLVKKDDILKANGATDASQIRSGMRIKIPVPAQ